MQDRLRVLREPTAICLTCRTALAEVEPCDGGPWHRVVDLRMRMGREALVAELWGPTPRPRRRPMRPYGALEQPRPPSGGARLTGVADGFAVPSPLRGDPCLAFATALRTSVPLGSNDLLWCEAGTSGFRLYLDEGGFVHIPAGRVRLEPVGRRARSAPREIARARLPAGLGFQVDGDLEFIPFDEAEEEIVRPGDRLTLVSGVELAEDPAADGGGGWRSLRAPVATMLVPVGVPILVAA